MWPRRRLLLVSTAVALVAGMVATGLARSSTGPAAGGTFRISLWAPLFNVDPARADSDLYREILAPTCARLMSYPDKPPPDGYRLEPEVAASWPEVSKDFKTYTFTIRRGFRFSNGERVLASAFARAFNRALSPALRSVNAEYVRDVVGADDVLGGTASSATGIVARGHTLTVRLARPVPDFAARTSISSFCAVPPDLPADAEGLRSFPAAGPYYVADFRPGQTIVLERNPYYGGKRPHHIDRFVVQLVSSREAALDQVARNEADWTFGVPPPVFLDPARGLVEKYGVNKTRLFVKPGLVARQYVLNTASPLFRGNPELRRAVSLAIDRSAQLESLGGPLATTLTDQHLPSSLPGFRNARLYPLAGPDLDKAKALARGRTRSGKAVLATRDNPPALALAQLVKRDLARIGLQVEVKAVPPLALLGLLRDVSQPWDLGFYFFGPAYLDPYAYLNAQFEKQFIGSTNVSRFNTRVFNRRLQLAARLVGEERYRAYGEIDVDLARDEAPVVTIGFQTAMTLVSDRVGCVVLRPDLDLTAACLK